MEVLKFSKYFLMIKSILYNWGFNYVQTIPVAYRSSKLTEKNKNKVLAWIVLNCVYHVDR